MSFRRSIFVAIALAVIATALFEVLLDVAVDGWFDEAAAGPLANRLLLDLLDVPLVIASAFAIAWGLTRLLGRPLRRLTHATREIAAERFTEPVPVPAGDDELAELARGFNRMSAAVQGYMERERAFTRYASHELRTPLSALRLQIERAELGHAELGEVLPALRRQVSRMEEVLEALLTLARSAEEGVGRRSLWPLIDETITALPASMRGRVTLAGAVPALEVSHPRLLQQALGNLLDNALRHGGAAATLSLETDGSLLRVRVRDEGRGVPEGSLALLTEPFYRAAEVDGAAPEAPDHGQTGLGLGLALVAFIARSLAGDLELRNAGPGLEALLTLPILTPAAGPGGAQRPA